MRVDQKRQIQEAVLNNMAPAYAGQVSLEDVARTFSGRGDLKEIEECLDDLTKNGLAEKTTVFGRTYYVFEGVASEAASRNENRLGEIQRELETLSKDQENTEQLLSEERDAVEVLRPIWFNGLEGSGLEPADMQRIQNYAALIINKPLTEKKRKLEVIGTKIQQLTLEKKTRAASKEESFITLPAKS